MHNLFFNSQMSDKVLVNVSNTLGNISGNRLYGQTYQFLYHMAIVDNISCATSALFKAENSVLTVHLISMMTDFMHEQYNQSMSYSSRMDLPTLQHLSLLLCAKKHGNDDTNFRHLNKNCNNVPPPPPLPVLTAKAPKPKVPQQFFHTLFVLSKTFLTPEPG